MKKFYYIEILRFITALSVLIFHYQSFFKPYSTFSQIDYLSNKSLQPFYSFLEIFYNYGHFGVPLFWAISGFVFAFVYLGENKNTSGKFFFVNRFARLYPLHFATLLFVALLQIISIKFSGNYQIYPYNDLFHFLLHIFFVSGWGFENGYSFNYPIWSVSVELIIYLVFFIFISNLNKYKIKFLFLIYLILLVVDKLGLDGGDENIISVFVDCAKLFFSGTFIFFLYESFKNKLYLILLSILLILFSWVGNFKLFLFFPAVLLFFASIEIFIHEKVKKIFQFFGNLTYALYLLHIPVQITIILLFGYFNILDEIFFSNYFFIFYLLLMIFLSFISFKFYEKPINNKIRSFFS